MSVEVVSYPGCRRSESEGADTREPDGMRQDRSVRLPRRRDRHDRDYV